jgi:hypothetical protein
MFVSSKYIHISIREVNVVMLVNLNNSMGYSCYFSGKEFGKVVKNFKTASLELLIKYVAKF